MEDSHLHFFSKGVFAFYARQAEALKDQLDPAAAAAAALGVEAPPAEPEALAARWAAELDRFGVTRAVLFGSAPGEQSAVARAVSSQPGRFVGFQMVNPRAGDAAAVVDAIADLGLRGVLLFPALHAYLPDDPLCRPVYEAARRRRLVVFVHLGRLAIAIRDRLGVRGTIDHTFGDPQHLSPVLREYHDVPFIVPHFGCGTLETLLAAARGVRNLYLDTSSSNAWMKDDPRFGDLARVFQEVLASPDLGPDRLLFGSDSTVFPRGWRADVHQAQAEALAAIGAPAADQAAIFGENLRRLAP